MRFLAVIWLAGMALLLRDHAVAQETDRSKQVIDLFDQAISSIHTYDLRTKAKMRYLYRSEPSTSGPVNPRTKERSPKLTMLRPGDKVREDQYFYRQVYNRGKGRVEVLEGIDESPSNITTYDNEVGRSRDVKSKMATISRTVKSGAVDGADYRETYRSVLTGVRLGDLARCLRQRPGYVVVHEPDAATGFVTVEAKPVPWNWDKPVDLGTWGFKVILDPGHGMMPAAIEVWQPTRQKKLELYRRTTVNQWKDLGNGLWAATKATTHVHYLDDGSHPELNGQIATETILTVDEARSSWNKPVDEEALRNPLPAGTIVTDTERKVRFVTGKADPGKNLADLAKHARDVGPIQTAPPPAPASWWPWLVRGSAILVGVVALGVLGRLFWNRRRRTAP